MKYKIKLVTGFNDDQKYTIDAEESHKAYYLFRNPEKRGVFSNGLALVGKSILAVQPDYHATMGWNVSHRLDDDDWNELHGKGVVGHLKKLMGKGSEISYLIEQQPELLGKSLYEIASEQEGLLLE